jgi:hypothetical protein
VDTYAQEVHHPGTAARRFTETIKALVSRTFRKEGQAMVNGMAKASGHKI